MIRDLARCPYCGGCEVALDDHPSVVLDPGGRQGPCPHLAWVDGRYAQWEVSPQGINRVIGSTEFRWDPARPGAAEGAEALPPHPRELAAQGPGWAFPPATPLAPPTPSAAEDDTHRRRPPRLLRGRG